MYDNLKKKEKRGGKWNNLRSSIVTWGKRVASWFRPAGSLLSSADVGRCSWFWILQHSLFVSLSQSEIFSQYITVVQLADVSKIIIDLAIWLYIDYIIYNALYYILIEYIIYNIIIIYYIIYNHNIYIIIYNHNYIYDYNWSCQCWWIPALLICILFFNLMGFCKLQM